MITASVIEDVTQIRSRNVSIAQQSMSSGDASASSSATRVTICCRVSWSSRIAISPGRGGRRAKPTRASCLLSRKN